MPSPLRHLLCIIALAASCQTRIEKAATPKDGADTLVVPKDKEEVEPTLRNIVEEFRDSVQTDKLLDTTQYIDRDTLRLVIRQQRMESSSFLLPKIYLEAFELDSLRIWNMSMDIRFYVNGRLVVEKGVRKEDFSPCMDKDLKRYGVLMYPEVDSLGAGGFILGFNISIPLANTGMDVEARASGSTVNCQCATEGE